MLRGVSSILVSGWSLGKRTHKIEVEFGDALVNTLEIIAEKKSTSVEELLRERVIQEWIGTRRMVNNRVFEERSKTPRRCDSPQNLPGSDNRADPT